MKIQELTLEYIRSVFHYRKSDSHKGSHGHSLLIAGNKNHMGAALISSKACLRSGTGLLTVCIPASEKLVIQLGIPEAMVVFQEDIFESFDQYTSIGFGPGIGQSESSLNLLKSCLSFSPKKFTLDADGLNLLSKHPELFDLLPEKTILTPHPKEFDRLFGAHTNTEDRIETAQKISKERNWIIVLKGYQTHILTKDCHFLNMTGNAGLAKGGSGDALTGIITGLFAQGYSSCNAACLGIYLLGKASEKCLQKQSVESMLITDVIENLGMVFAEISG